MEEEKNSKLLILRIVVSLALALVGQFYLAESNFGFATNFATMIISYLIISYDLYIEAFKKIFKEKDYFNEITLMIIASIGAFCLRLFGPGFNEFFEGILVILLYQAGELLEDFAAEKSKGAISASLDVRNEKGRVDVGGNVVEKNAESLVIGDVVIFGNGNKVLCDGKVTSGTALVDESSLTGEALLVKKEVGSEVYSGTTIFEGSIKVQVTKQYEDSTIGQILATLQNSEERKSKATRFITRFARIYTPIVVAIAFLVATVIPLFLGIANSNLNDTNLWSSWIYNSLNILVISCPCAIVISIPLAYFSGLGLASKNGILVKGASFLDHINNLKAICFDKTGTLTKGEFCVDRIETFDCDETKIIEIMSAAESRSSHPIGRALIREYGNCYKDEMISSYEEKAGEGIYLCYNNANYFVGKDSNDESNIAETCIEIREENKVIGRAYLSDLYKENADSLIDYVKRKGIKTVLISGDKKINVIKAKEELNLDECYFELSPIEKTEIVEKIINESSGSTMYVGDGINDVTSIVRSDVGVTMGGLGSDITVSKSDVVIVNDDILQIGRLIKIALLTKRYSIFNIAFSISVKVGILALSIASSLTNAFILPLWASVLTDTGLAILMVLSSLSIYFRKIKNL